MPKIQMIIVVIIIKGNKIFFKKNLLLAEINRISSLSLLFLQVFKIQYFIRAFHFEILIVIAFSLYNFFSQKIQIT